MGLFSFFTKKSHADLKADLNTDLKTCGYDTTVASSPPIRGTYPVPGNGAKILEEFQKAHPGLSTVASTSRLRPRADGPRGSDAERPRTAPSQQPGGTASFSSWPSPPPELPAIPRKRYGPYKLPPKIFTDIQTSSLPLKSAPLFGLASPYSASIRSGESSKSKGYVDLLEAQSKLKPYDFYGRIQATGARNYGEDVAERNRGDIKSLGTTEVQESHSNHADANLDSAVSGDIDDEDDDELPRRPKIRHSMGSALRSKYAGFTPESFPKRTSSLFPLRDADDISMAADWATSEKSQPAPRPTSIHSFSTPKSSGGQQEPSAERQDEAKGSDQLPFSLGDRTQAATVHEQEYIKSNMSTKRQPHPTPDTEHPLHQKYSNLDKPLPALPPLTGESPRPRATSQGPAKRRSTHTIRSVSRGEATQSSSNRNSARYQPGSTTDPQGSFYNLPAQQRMIAFHDMGADEKDELNQPIYVKRSAISLSNKSVTAREIQNYIPERTSSLRPSSLTSDTVMSTRSSTLFRPQSSHSTSTSVDAPSSFSHVHSDPSIPPVPDIPFLMSSPMAKRPSTVSSQYRLQRASHRHQPSEFFLDDYASSNDGSAPPSRGSYEKELLFVDSGYGKSGPQLSGLPGLFDIAVPTPDADPQNRTRQNEVRPGAGLLRMPAYFEMDSNPSDQDLNYDIPTRRNNRGRELFSTNR